MERTGDLSTARTSSRRVVPVLVVLRGSGSAGERGDVRRQLVEHAGQHRLDHSLTSVSCASPSFCVAVDDWGRAIDVRRQLVERAGLRIGGPGSPRCPARPRRSARRWTGVGRALRSTAARGARRSPSPPPRLDDPPLGVVPVVVVLHRSRQRKCAPFQRRHVVRAVLHRRKLCPLRVLPRLVVLRGGGRLRERDRVQRLLVERADRNRQPELEEVVCVVSGVVAAPPSMATATQ